MFRILKPGGKLGFYDWVMSEKYDPKSKSHNDLKLSIERGNGIANLISKNDVFELLKKSGFEIIEFEDLAEYKTRISKGNDVHWNQVFAPGFSWDRLSMTKAARWCINKILLFFEIINLAPKGTSQIHNTLSKGADALFEAGQTGIFTPMLFVIAKKPVVV
ncbi:hypothetical protein MHBO_003262 [Bonamia ostreae]|uniref:SAM-dependent methyltransferase Erg6/SMT-type domain-containing protein n=1 Tax=Bonamia ostreae TaxID=126728 RepID=A0ABV2APX6_9EUKA